jgi:hypothetical protein
MGGKRATCRQGHPLVEGNLYHDKRGTRSCKTCKRERAKKYQREYRAQAEEGKQEALIIRGKGPCHHRWAQHVCIADKGHSRSDHRCNCGDTWGVA